MLTQEENDRLTSVGPGTPMGNVLRRYWHPVGGSALVTTKPQRVKVLGEELVLYRGAGGNAVLMQLRCAHRGVALDHGRVEGDAIRCPYHGWLYDGSGQCLAQPAEIKESPDGIRLTSYRTEEAGGIVFAYLGPEPAPLLPLYDVLSAEGQKQLILFKIDVNWLQAVEQNTDIAHFCWLHGYTFPRMGGKKPRIRVERTAYGMEIQADFDGGPPDIIPFALPGFIRFTLPPIQPDGKTQEVMLQYVARDDTSYEGYLLTVEGGDSSKAGDCGVIPASRIDPKFGEYKPLPGDWWGIDLEDQDRMASEQQGVIADRTKEHLVASDIAIVQLRRLLQEAIEAVQRGDDPVGVIRDPAKQQLHLNHAFRTGRQDNAGYSVTTASQPAKV